MPLSLDRPPLDGDEDGHAHTGNSDHHDPRVRVQVTSLSPAYPSRLAAAENPLRHWAAEHGPGCSLAAMSFDPSSASLYGDAQLMTLGLQVVETTIVPTARKRPRGYVRQDARIREDICERLHHARQIDTRDVTVEVEAGLVRFEGSVPQRAMKTAIESLVETCLGVKEIDNRVRVRRPLRLYSDRDD